VINRFSGVILMSRSAQGLRASNKRLKEAVEMKIHPLTKAMIGLTAVGAAGAAYVLVQKRRHAESIPAKGVEVHGYVNSGYEAVREAFTENFSRHREIGAACCVYHGGEKVVDLWGGVRNNATGELWVQDTMALVYSATKGLSAMTLAVANSRGWLDYDELVCTYWPEFAQNGKEKITVRQLLAHQAGLFALDQPIDRNIVVDLDRLAEILARQKPAWEPGTRQAYHAITLGFYENELLRRIDPQHRSLGQFFQDEIATPLGLDFYIRLPESISDSQLAPLIDPSFAERMFGFPFRMALAALNPRSNIRRALLGSELAHDEKRIYPRNLEIPAGGGVGTARAIAHAYSVFAGGGKELGLRYETMQELTAPAVPATHGFFDECLRGEVPFSLGFMKPNAGFPFGSVSAFGFPGAGGSLGFADPEAQIGYAYVPNRKGTTMGGDPRDVALRRALFSATPAARTM
jgi:CubicO group peptidase (beta-lactamase class C family)